MSLANRAIVEAAQAGYSVAGGVIVDPSGHPCKMGCSNRYPTFSVPIHFHPRYKTMPVYAHRFVAYLKYGDALFLPTIQVRHKDSNRSNFDQSNILIGSVAENARDVDPNTEQVRAQKCAMSQGKNYVPLEAVEEIRRVYQEYLKTRSRVPAGVAKEFAEKYGVSSSAIGNIAYGRSYLYAPIFHN